MASEDGILDLRVTGAAAGRRLDAFVADAAKAGASPAALSREAVKKAIREGRCRVDGAVERNVSAKVKAGMRVELDLPSPSCTPAAEEGDLDILHADGDIAVCNKPAGLTVHPCPSCPSGTLLQRLIARFPSLADMEGERPGIVHRIDKDTSGLIVVALGEKARLQLAADFAAHRIRKEYLALVAGVVPGKGRVDEPVGRDPLHKVRMAVVPENHGGREAHTTFERVWVAPREDASLVRVRILTGRTHQIRVHMAHLGHPLLGDALYAKGTVAAAAPRQMLHAWHLSFSHPADGRPMHFTCPPPEDFRQCVLGLGEVTRTLVVTGNPGSGKSTLTQLLAERGIPTTSADDLVAGYYAKGGEIAAFLERNLGCGVLDEEGKVDRGVLMQAFEKSPDLRHTVEQLAHGLVLGDIRDFFARQAEARVPLACAEIPLYFECGWHRTGFDPRPLAIGVHAGLATRGGRLARTRGWDEGKIGAIEGWQWPEDKKMSACDLVVANEGTPQDLAEKVDGTLLPELARRAAENRGRLEARLAALWESPDDGR